MPVPFPNETRDEKTARGGESDEGDVVLVGNSSLPKRRRWTAHQNGAQPSPLMELGGDNWELRLCNSVKASHGPKSAPADKTGP